MRIGSVVRLKSGGPDMTVTELVHIGDYRQANLCVRYEKTKKLWVVIKEVFPDESLTDTEPKVGILEAKSAPSPSVDPLPF